MLTLKRRNRRTTAASRLRASRTIPFLLVAVLTGSVLTTPAPTPAEADTPAASAATAKWLNLPLLTEIPVASLAHTATAYSAAGPNRSEADPLNLSLLSDNPNIALGNITLPLFKTDEQSNGLLNFGSLGALSSYSSSQSPDSAHASTGLLDDQGALQLSENNDPGLTSASLNLSALLTQVLDSTGGSVLLPNCDTALPMAGNSVLSTADLEIGAVGSEIQTQPISGSTFPVEDNYVLTDLKLNVVSPLVEDITDCLQRLVNNIVIAPLRTLDTSLLGAVETLLGSLRPLGLTGTNEISIDTVPLLSAVEDLLDGSLMSADQSIIIDLQTGAIKIDLGKFVVQGHNPNPSGTQWVDLSELGPNTPVLDEATITAILNGVSSLLWNGDPESTAYKHSLNGKLLELLTDGVLGLGITIKLELQDICILFCPDPADTNTLLISGTLAQFAGLDGEKPPTISGSALSILGIDLGKMVFETLLPLLGIVLKPLVHPVTGLVATLQPLLISTVSEGLLTPLIGTTEAPGLLRTLLDNLVQITINRQPTMPMDPTDPTTVSDGDLGPGSFTVRSLELVLLPKVTDNGAVAVQLGSSTVIATVPSLLTLQKTLSQDSPYPWARGAAVSDWKLHATRAETEPGFTTTAAEIAQPVPLLPGTYTLSESATTTSSGLPPTAYRGAWQCTDTDGVFFIPPLGAAETPGTASITLPSSDMSTGTVTNLPTITCTVTNTLISATAAWQKTDGGSPPLPLSGAEWTLARVTAPAQTSIPVTELVGDGSGFEAASLPVGTYTLTESRAPIGFLAGPATTFVVQPDGSITGLPENIGNLPLAIPEIPLTGGWGTMHNMITGLLLLIGAISSAIFAYSRTRKRSS